MTRRLLRLFGKVQRPAAWCLLIGAAVTFGVVVTDLVVLGNAKLGTLLIAADLVVSGMAAAQEAENEVDRGGQARG